MLTESQGKLTATLFDSVMEPYGLLSKEWKLDHNKARADKLLNGKEKGGDAQGWYGAPSLSELNRRLKEGWPEGSERLLQLATREINPQSIRRRRERADQGAELDIHAVYRGDLSRAWMRTRRRQGSGVRSVSIVVNLGDNCGANADEMFWRGAAALKLADALTQSGYSVAILGAEGVHRYFGGKQNVLTQFVSIKDEDQPLDVDRLAALTAMPGYFRTAMFAGICYHADQKGEEVDWGLGSNDADAISRGMKLLPVPQTAFVQGNINSKQAAEEWIDSVLNSIENPEQMAA